MNNRCEPASEADAQSCRVAEHEARSCDCRSDDHATRTGAWYAAAILAIAGALSQIDRQIMGLLMEPVKQDLALSDVQVSLLYGLAFVLFHTVAAFPLGYLCDRGSRRSLIAISVFLWSLATASCGLARNFAQLFSARLGVGVGEATLQPATQSLLPDYFGTRSLPKAFGVVQTGILVGGGCAYALGGVILALVGSATISLPILGAIKPWQATFLIISSPGPIVALLMLTVREPDRRSNRLLVHNPVPGSFGSYLRSRRWFLIGHLGSVAVTAILSFAVLAWTPSYLIRTFRWTPVQAGMGYGIILMLAGGAGTILGSTLSNRLARSGRADAPLRANLFALVLGTPLAIAFPITQSPILALACLAGFSFCVGITSTMMPAILQIATPHPFRGRIGAFYVFATAAVGAALGPVLVAMVTQYIFSDPTKLHLAIATVCALAGPLAIALAVWTYQEFARSIVPFGRA